MTKANKAWYREKIKTVVGIVTLAFILAGSFGGAITYYRVYVQDLGVTLNDGSKVHRNDLVDWMLIERVKQAQEENERAHEHAE